MFVLFAYVPQKYARLYGLMCFITNFALNVAVFSFPMTSNFTFLIKNIDLGIV